MLFEQEYNDAYLSFQSRIVSLQSLHEQLARRNNEKRDDWQKRWNDHKIEKKLSSTLRCIKCKKFRKTIKCAIKTKQLSPDTRPGDFDKMMLCIKLLNKAKVKRKIFKYNPSYCQKLIDSITNEYLHLRHWLKIQNLLFETEEQESFENTCVVIKKEWGVFCNKNIDAIAKKSAKSIRMSFE